ncbi:MAG TPA: NFACT RNA binding domain-containing protein [Pyrinomonadaceae bacterium]|nr:NFACT RNA binding domain-containing protein [Pyrinomonadaceae bacterium]
MNYETLKQIVDELSALLKGRFLGRVIQVSPSSLAIDFGLKRGGSLFISIDPAAPRLYLITRSARDLEKTSTAPSVFAQALRSRVGGSSLDSVSLDHNERVVRFSFPVEDDLGAVGTVQLIAQLTGRSANLFMVDAADIITHALRNPKGDGQQIGELYHPPPQQTQTVSEAPLERGKHPSLSAAAEDYYEKVHVETAFDERAKMLMAALRKEATRRTKLRTNLQKDLAAHGNPEDHKRLGDLLLANIAHAERKGDKVLVKDYFAENVPTIELEVDKNLSLQDAAAESFSRYGKSKRAIEEIGARLIQLSAELAEGEKKRADLELAIASGDPAALERFEQPKAQAKAPAVSSRQKSKDASTLRGMRRYLSSDGYEVIVGRTARDNDTLTFKVARPNDLWLHAGDYPGSHVIVRNSSRSEIPHRTIVEAAQLAAKFSQASKDSKVNIHYTRRKFLSKPKGAAPGLVRLSNFKTITVEPGENMERVR